MVVRHRDLEEYYHTGYVIDNFFLLNYVRLILTYLLPLFESSFYEGVSSGFWSVLFVEGKDNLGYVLVAQEFPHSVTGNDEELVIQTQSELHHLWFC